MPLNPIFLWLNLILYNVALKLTDRTKWSYKYLYTNIKNSISILTESPKKCWFKREKKRPNLHEIAQRTEGFSKTHFVNNVQVVGKERAEGAESAEPAEQLWWRPSWDDKAPGQKLLHE